MPKRRSSQHQQLPGRVCFDSYNLFWRHLGMDDALIVSGLVLKFSNRITLKLDL